MKKQTKRSIWFIKLVSDAHWLIFITKVPPGEQQFRVVHPQELMLSDADSGFLSCLSQTLLPDRHNSKSSENYQWLFTSSHFHDHHIQPGDEAETSQGLQPAVQSRRKEDLLQPLPKAASFTVFYSRLSSLMTASIQRHSELVTN